MPVQPEQPKYRIGMTIAACVWLGLFPLLQGGTYARITHDKWVITLVLTVFTAFCFFAEEIVSRHVILSGAERSRRISSPAGVSRRSVFPLLLASALFLWTVLSCLFSSYGPDTWWISESARYEGLLTQLCYYILFICFFFSRVSLKPVLLSAAGGVGAFFTVVLLQRGGGNPFGLFPFGRSYELNPEFQGTIGNIDMGTGYLLLLTGLFLYSLLSPFPVNRLSRHFRTGSAIESVPAQRSLCIVHYALCIVTLFALLLTVFLIITMNVQFGTVTLSVLLLFTLLRFLPKKARLPLLIFLVILVLLVVWFWPGSSGGVWELHEILHGRGRLSFGSDRVAVWLYSLGLARENLLLGGGSGTFEERFNRYLTDRDLVIPDEQDGLLLPNYFDNPHNEYIAQLTDHGLPALLLFVALLVFAVFRRRDSLLPLLTPCTAAVLCYAVQAFFSFSVCLVAPVFWILLAMSFRKDI